MSSECKTLHFVGGLFVGSVIGGAVGMLLAPESGTEIRGKIREGAEGTFGDVYDQVVEYGETLKVQFQDVTDSLTDRVNQYKVQIENKIQEIQDEVNQDIDELNDELEALKNDAEDGEITEEEVVEEVEGQAKPEMAETILEDLTDDEEV